METWGNHGVIQGGVEHGAGILILALNVNLAQFLVPGGAGGSLGGLEVPARELGLHVGLGAFH